MDRKKLSESKGRTCVSVRQGMSRSSFDATISARRGPLLFNSYVVV